jgi:hypothetical protein
MICHPEKGRRHAHTHGRLSYEFKTKKAQTHHADAQYTERKRLDLAVPKILFPRIVQGLHVVREAIELDKLHLFSESEESGMTACIDR